jgi:hypothetical protein
MFRTVTHQGLLLGTLLATLSAAPSPPEKSPTCSPLLEKRYKAALKLYDVAWVYYREKRINAPMLYNASSEVLKSECDLRDDRAGRMAAFKAHAKRFNRLNSLLEDLKRKRVGISSYDLAAAEYFKLQVEYMLGQERAR